MATLKTPNLFIVIIAVIVGAALFKQFDVQTMTFEKPALAIVYAIVFIPCIVIIVKNMIKK